MKLNPYSIVLIMVFIIEVLMSNQLIKRTKQKYEKTYYDSSSRLNDDTISIRKM